MGFQTFLALLLCIVSVLAGVAPAKYPQYAGIADFIFWAAIFLLLILIAVMVWSNRKHLIAGVKRLTGIQWLLLSGIGGTWLFLTITLGTVAWLVMNSFASGIGIALTQKDEGPISWVYNLSMERAGLNGVNIAALRFRGANTSKKHVQLKEAAIISLIDGTRLPLEIVASNSKGEPRIVSIDKVQLVPPGAPIELLAKFGPPDPNVPSYVLGVDADTFLAKWRQFSFEATDDTRSYRMEFNENIMMVFFQGKVGPRVAIKPEAE